MKNILITGANSYVGTSFEKWLSQWPDRYHVDTIDMIDGTWREKSFKGYDAVFHVAGIAHRKETKENVHLYYEVNRDMAIETAKKAKADGVHHFIFMSSMSVYGMETGVITKDTVPMPKTHYGKSKLDAEKGILKFSDESFRIAILRPPMIYGNGCKGNYQKLAKLAKITPVFPDIENKRSMIYIDNLSEFVRSVIDSQICGVLLPQNKEYICTRELVAEIAKQHNRYIYMSALLSSAVYCLMGCLPTINKVFGTLYYRCATEKIGVFDFSTSVYLTEKALCTSTNEEIL